MITGVVTANREAVIQVHVRGADGHIESVDAVIDTGFNGFLTLPARRVASLTLTYAGSTRAVLGDGQEVPLDLFEATVLWDGREREVAVLAVEGSALVGMALLSGYRVTLEVKSGGVVTIESLS